MAAFPVLLLEKVIPEPEKTAIISVDVINKFLYERLLSRPGAAEIDEPISQLTSAFSNDLLLR